MKTALAIIGMMVFIGCDDKDWFIDQQKPHKYFIECLKTVPIGPTMVDHNDWGKVVSECADASQDQAKYWGYAK